MDAVSAGRRSDIIADPSALPRPVLLGLSKLFSAKLFSANAGLGDGVRGRDATTAAAVSVRACRRVSVPRQ